MADSPAPDLTDADPFSASFNQNPHPYYRAMQRGSAVFPVPDKGLSLVTRHSLIGQILRDPATFSSAFGEPNERRSGPVARELEEILGKGWPYLPTLLNADPPQHTRYRRVVASYFKPRRLEELRPDLETIINRLIDEMPDGETFDLVPRFSVPLPIEAIARVLHFPPDRLADLKRWSDDAVAGTGTAPSDERLLEAARGIVELQHYLAEQLRSRQAKPIGDLMSDLVEAEIVDDEPGPDGSEVRRPLTMAEMLSIVRQILVAGNETTTNALTEGIRLLAENPDEWARLKADPAGRATAVTEEVLRLSSPLSSMFRVVRADTEIGGCPVSAGARVVNVYGAANRDPDLWDPDPDAFNPDRGNLGDHIDFGKGIHFCLGAPLARLEMRMAFEALARRIDTIELTEENTFDYHPSFVLRGLRELRVRMTKHERPAGN